MTTRLYVSRARLYVLCHTRDFIFRDVREAEYAEDILTIICSWEGKIFDP